MQIEKYNPNSLSVSAILGVLKANLATNCVPFEVCRMTHADYETFLSQRRALMAKKIKGFYNSL